MKTPFLLCVVMLVLAVSVKESDAFTCNGSQTYRCKTYCSSIGHCRKQLCLNTGAVAMCVCRMCSSKYRLPFWRNSMEE